MVDKFFNNVKKDDGVKIESLPIAEIVDNIKKAIVLKQEGLKKSGIKIKKIDLTLKTLAVVDAGAKISLQIPIWGKIEFGSKLSEKSLQTTKLALKIPNPNQIEETMELKEMGEKMDETIAERISDIIEGVKSANNVNGDSPFLEMEEGSVEMNFILSGSSKISLIIESGFEAELSNNLKIIFEKE